MGCVLRPFFGGPGCGRASCSQAGVFSLSSQVGRLERDFEPRIQEARAHAGDVNESFKKTFIYFLLGDKPQIDPESAFAQFALQEQILGIVNGYMGMCSQLRYYNVWHTL